MQNSIAFRASLNLPAKFRLPSRSRGEMPGRTFHMASTLRSPTDSRHVECCTHNRGSILTRRFQQVGSGTTRSDTGWNLADIACRISGTPRNGEHVA
jgi:hypothetical protein